MTPVYELQNSVHACTSHLCTYPCALDVSLAATIVKQLYTNYSFCFDIKHTNISKQLGILVGGYLDMLWYSAIIYWSMISMNVQPQQIPVSMYMHVPWTCGTSDVIYKITCVYHGGLAIS